MERGLIAVDEWRVYIQAMRGLKLVLEISSKTQEIRGFHCCLYAWELQKWLAPTTPFQVIRAVAQKLAPFDGHLHRSIYISNARA